MWGARLAARKADPSRPGTKLPIRSCMTISKCRLQKLPHAVLYSHFAWLLLKNSLVHFPDVSLYCDCHKPEQRDFNLWTITNECPIR